MKQHRIFHLMTTIAIYSILILLGALSLTSCSDDVVGPRGPVPSYKVDVREVFGAKGTRTIVYKISAMTQDSSALQFAAQELIIKEAGKDLSAESVIVNFMDRSAGRDFPLASMLWVRHKKQGFLGGLGLFNPDPFETGRWRWSPPTPQQTVFPPITIVGVEIEESDGSVRVEGAITDPLSEVSYVVYQPSTKPLGKMSSVTLPEVGAKLTFAWRPPARFVPSEGLYVMRLKSKFATGAQAPEIWLKLDLAGRSWLQPPELIPVVPTNPDAPPVTR